MKVIFLDVDGVLNAESDYIYQSGPNKGKDKIRAPHVGGWWCEYGVIRGIDNKKVKRLAKIVEATGAKIVLVSSWKNNYENFLKTHRDTYGRYLYNKLAAQGLTIYDTTYQAEAEEYSHRRRGHGILVWLKHQQGHIESWVALDDEDWDYYDQQLIRVVQTSDNRMSPGGLLDSHVETAIRILNNKE